MEKIADWVIDVVGSLGPLGVFVLGENWVVVEEYLSILQIVVLAVLAGLFLRFLVRRRSQEAGERRGTMSG